MCDCIEGEDGERPTALAVDVRELMDKTRAIEERKPGPPVPEDLWPVFFGFESGGIPWLHHARMVACRETALAFLRARARPRRRAPSQADIQCT